MPDTTEPAHHAPRSWSVAKRLAALHIIAVLVSYTLFGSLFYAKRMKSMEQVSVRDLEAERTSVVAILKEPAARELMAYEVRSQQYEPEQLRPFIRILDREGRVLLESPWQEKIPSRAFPAPGRTVRWRHVNDDTYLLGSFLIPPQPFTGPGALLQLGVNTHEVADRSSQFRLSLLAFLASGTAFAFACAHFIVKLALRPLDDISRTARNITRRRLDTRIDENSLPVELVSLAHSFNSMLERLEDSFSRLSHYSANLAHELRTPINTLMIESDIALSKDRSPEEYRRVITSGLEEYGRLSWTIDRLLFLARAELESGELDRQRVDLGEAVEDVLDYFSDAAEENGVTLKCDGTGVLMLDQTLFRRAVSNLVSNAIAHTPQGGLVLVSVLQSEKGEARITVTDNGCGIEQVHLPRIFDRFYRVASNGARKTDGTGLGLAIVKTIMQMHGGTVSIESCPGQGTTVTLDFPPA